MIINAKLPIAADKREIKDFFKLPSATSFIRKMVGKRPRINRRKITMGERRREYVDKDHEVMDNYYDLSEKYNRRNAKSIKRQLKQLIEKDPDSLDLYLLLYEILQEEGDLQEAERVLDEAYDRALKLIKDKKGNWPDLLRWGWLENRHIIRTILNKAISLWESKKMMML